MLDRPQCVFALLRANNDELIQRKTELGKAGRIRCAVFSKRGLFSGPEDRPAPYRRQRQSKPLGRGLSTGLRRTNLVKRSASHIGGESAESPAHTGQGLGGDGVRIRRSERRILPFLSSYACPHRWGR